MSDRAMGYLVATEVCLLFWIAVALFAVGGLPI